MLTYEVRELLKDVDEVFGVPTAPDSWLNPSAKGDPTFEPIVKWAESVVGRPLTCNDFSSYDLSDIGIRCMSDEALLYFTPKLLTFLLSVNTCSHVSTALRPLYPFHWDPKKWTHTDLRIRGIFSSEQKKVIVKCLEVFAKGIARDCLYWSFGSYREYWSE